MLWGLKVVVRVGDSMLSAPPASVSSGGDRLAKSKLSRAGPVREPVDAPSIPSPISSSSSLRGDGVLGGTGIGSESAMVQINRKECGYANEWLT